MKFTHVAGPAFIFLLAAGTGAGRAQYGPPQQGYAQGGWDAPPAEYRDDLHRQAFHDGIEAARHDFGAHLPLKPELHEEFRHPQVPDPGARDMYRDAYRRGYSMAVEHLRAGGGGAPPPPPPAAAYAGGGWDVPPGEFNDDLRRHAFHDGIEAARLDFQHQMQPDPARHQEFQHPQVPFPARDTYRDAYKRGYFVAVEHMRGGPR